MASGGLTKADQARYNRYQAIQAEIAKLEVEMEGVDCEKVVKEHIRALNEYNERKDACSILIGKIADLERTTIIDVYKRLDLSPED
ncbi:hypothetical protein P389DRAFT_209803 [Cystobasidium minutum MCA 4210]|uniref:uncharacterized protein n=1 Tax=Cystobasidium minutum MCA 4210 TaxID=1397322 RepID=UPI0034CFA941|eukprot:jgi/Rhomi1/209803/estExt_Genemark1.C_3_t10455